MLNMNVKYSLMSICFCFLLSCNKNEETKQIEKVVDWTNVNLGASTFRNGDTIKEVKSSQEWINATSLKFPAWCYYNFDSVNGSKYGKLYNLFAINDSRNIAPNGYRIPNDKDWSDLINKNGGVSVAGLKMKSSSGWYNNGNGTNESLFNGLAGGFYGSNYFQNINKSGFWWSKSFDSTFNTNSAYVLDFGNNAITHIGSNDLSAAYSVRCVKE